MKDKQDAEQKPIRFRRGQPGHRLLHGRSHIKVPHIEVEVGKRYMTRSGNIAAILGKNVKGDNTTYWGAIAGIGLATWYVNGMCIQNITHDITHDATEEELHESTQEKIAQELAEKHSMEERVTELEQWRKEPNTLAERAIFPLLFVLLVFTAGNITLTIILLMDHLGK